MKKINWKVRFKNKVFLASFLGLIISFVFGMMALFDIYPAITENQILKIVDQVLLFLGLIGIVEDPTTAELTDSRRALGYDTPYKDEDPTNG